MEIANQARINVIVNLIRSIFNNFIRPLASNVINMITNRYFRLTKENFYYSYYL